MNKKAFSTLMIAACSAALISGYGYAPKSSAESKTAETVNETTEEKEAKIQEAFKDAQYIEIGTTGYFIKIPKSYYQGEVYDNERKDDMIAYYKSDEFLMDFDVYQFPNEGKDLYDYTEAEAKQYNADGITEVTINDTDLGLYYSTESYEGEEGEFTVANYIFVSGNDFGELSFWQDGDEAEELAKTIINSITTTPEESSAEALIQGDDIDYSYLMIDSLITVKSDTQTNQSFTLVDTKDLAPEEDANVYYDGVLIDTVKVSK